LSDSADPERHRVEGPLQVLAQPLERGVTQLALGIRGFSRRLPLLGEA
jgi:hypothetical protein